MKKIIHMSDLHIGYRGLNARFLEIVQSLHTRVEDKPSKYVVVVTGDLVNNANKEGSYEEVQKGLEHLRQTGFKHVLVIPGNHDYGTGSKGDRKFVKLFQEAFFRKNVVFPKVDIIDRVAFIGLDSMSAEMPWYNDLWAEGQIGTEQLARLAKILKKDRVTSCAKRVIYLHHHPFKWRPLHQLRDSRKLKKVLMQVMAQGISIDAILFGHNHEGKSHGGKWGIARCYDAGAATLKPLGKYIDWSKWFRVRSSIREIDLNKPAQSDRVLSFELEEKAGAKV